MLDQENQWNITPVLQYIKDLSVEHPNPSDILSAQEEELTTHLNLDVQPSPLGNDLFEVILFVKAEINKEGTKGFVLDLQYAGIFAIKDASEDILPLLLFIKCPEILFPGARHIARTMAQESGLPGFTLPSADFVDLFRKKIENQADSLQTMSDIVR
jgi:preprotein translocase subunit SecB